MLLTKITRLPLKSTTFDQIMEVQIATIFFQKFHFVEFDVSIKFWGNKDQPLFLSFLLSLAY
jgi:hypothetical protein